MNEKEKQAYFEKCIKNQLFPGNDGLKQIILEKIAEKLELNKTYTDEELRNILKKFYPDEFPTIRREFINYGYMHCDSGKGIFILKKKKLSREDILKNEKLARDAADVGLI